MKYKYRLKQCSTLIAERGLIHIHIGEICKPFCCVVSWLLSGVVSCVLFALFGVDILGLFVCFAVY